MKFRSVFVLVFCLAAAACTTEQTTQPGAIGVERRQSFLVSGQEVERASAEAYQQIVDNGRKDGAINTDRAQLDRVRRIADRIVPHTAVFRPDAVRWNWEVNVLANETINATCMAGGKIMVYTGLIEKLNVTDAELAAVLGHEIGHALREHSREKVSNSYAQQFVLLGAAVATGASADTVRLAGLVTDVAFTLPNSREMETEADHIGFELMARAGYDPNAAVTLFQKMGRASGGGGPSFLSTHPQSEARAADLRANIPRVLPLYQAAPIRD